MSKFTELEAARRFSKLHGQDVTDTPFAFDLARGVWRRCESGVWRIADGAAHRGMTAIVEEAEADGNDARNLYRYHTIRGAVNQAAREMEHAADLWNRDAWALCVPGGWIDLRELKFCGPDPERHFTMQAAVTPIPKGEAPALWLQCLDQWTGGDQDLIDYLQRLAGYCLTGSVREHALLWLHGSGGNGKGTFVNTLTGILGNYARPIPQQSLLQSRGNNHPTDIAGIVGRRLVVAGELGAGAWNIELVKQLTGGDMVSARFMRRDFFEFYPVCKLMVVGNERPSLRVVDPAIKRRLHLIPFTQSIANPDRKLESKLREEWPAILTWAVQGVAAWRKRGELGRPAAVEQYGQAYLDDQDLMGQFLEERCREGPEMMHAAGELFQAYRAWAESQGLRPMSARTFGQRLSDRGFDTHRGTGGRRYRRGLMLSEPLDLGRAPQYH